MADPRSFFNLTISEILAGIQSCLTERGCHLLVYSHQSEKGRITQSEIIQSRATDGVIFINTRASRKADIQATIGELDAAQIPFVMINSAQEFDGINYVGVDELKTGREAARYLIGKGHTHIGMIAGTPTPTSDLLRRGFRSELKSASIAVRDEWFGSGAFEEETTVRAVRKMVAKKRRPTALFCTSDLMVPFIYGAIAAEGLRVPGDVAVLGRGDLMFARFLAPPLTSLAFPFFDIGYLSAGLLIDSVKERESARKRILLEAKLVERESA